MPFGPIGILPRGLMGMLGIKTPSFPQQLADEVQTSIDLMQFLLSANALEQVSNDVSVSAIGTFNSGLGPTGREAWLVRGFAVEVACTNVQAAQVRAAVLRTAGADLDHALVSPDNGFNVLPTVTPQDSVAVSTLNGPLLIGPGDVLGGLVTYYYSGVGTLTMSTTASILRIPY